MTAQEKAKAGLWMIEQAVLQLIRENGPMQPVQASDALGLSWQRSNGERAGSIAFDIIQAMADTGKLVKGDGVRPTYSLPAPTH